MLLDLLYAAGLIAAAPYLLAKMVVSERYRAGLGERLGRVRLNPGRGPCVWLHAVSVGEVNAARTLIRLMRAEYPEWRLVISTTTDTGQALAKSQYPDVETFYFPLDFSWVVTRVLRRVNPTCIVLVELEIWPGLFRAARQAGVPIVIVNGRIREESLSPLRAVRRLVPEIVDDRTPNLYCMQNETYAARFRGLGIPTRRIRVTGTMKYDTVVGRVDGGEREALRKALGIARSAPVIVGGSTWPGEEAILLQVYRTLRAEVPGLRLVLAPRHVERAADVAACIRAAGLACLPRTDTPARAHARGQRPVILMDTIGELPTAYSLATCAFVGKSLAQHGGHNVLEPAGLGVATLFGPHMENFADEARSLLAEDAAVQVRNADQIIRAVHVLLRDPERRRAMADRAREVIRRNQGATRRNLQAITGQMTRARGTAELA